MGPLVVVGVVVGVVVVFVLVVVVAAAVVVVVVVDIVVSPPLSAPEGPRLDSDETLGRDAPGAGRGWPATTPPSGSEMQH